MESLKLCNGCNQELPVDAFNKRMKRGKRVLRSRCRDCERSYGREQWAKNGANPPIWRRHRMTDEQYWEMYNKQNGQCANPQCDGDAEVIDHDHTCCPGKRSCGKCVMGLLCAFCNTAEGLLRSNPNLALGLAEYMIMTRRVVPNDVATNR